MNYTALGLTDIGSGLRAAKTLIKTERAGIRQEMGILEARLSALGRIEAALDAAVEIITGEMRARDTEKASP